MKKNRRSHAIYTGNDATGNWVAASAVSPYFFFIGQSEEEVTERARCALNFLFEAQGVLKHPPSLTSDEILVSRLSHLQKKEISII